MSMKLSTQEMKAVFDHFDLDKSGKICTSEMVEVLNRCGLAVSKQDCDELISQFDQNLDKEMDWDEFAHFIEYVHSKL
jgi:Ca2+-binding EF-hand superfamily protein